MQNIFDVGLEGKITKNKLLIIAHFNQTRKCGCIKIYKFKKLVIDNLDEMRRSIKVFQGQLYMGCQEQGDLSEGESWISPDERLFLWEHMPFQFKDLCIFPMENGRRFFSVKRLYPIGSKVSFSVENNLEQEFVAILEDFKDLKGNLGDILLKIGVSEKDLEELERKILFKFQS